MRDSLGQEEGAAQNVGNTVHLVSSVLLVFLASSLPGDRGGGGGGGWKMCLLILWCPAGLPSAIDTPAERKRIGIIHLTPFVQCGIESVRA